MDASPARPQASPFAPCIRRSAGRNAWPITIPRSVFLGDLTQVHVDWGGRDLIVRQIGMQAWSAGQLAVLSVAPEHCVLLEEAWPAPIGRRGRPRSERVEKGLTQKSHTSR
jgi:TOBE domain